MYFDQIEFYAAFGEETKTVGISYANGSGDGTLHLFFDRYYQGIIIHREPGWVLLFQLYTDAYTTAEINTLLDIVKTNF